jgi:hypothetical protein
MDRLSCYRLRCLISLARRRCISEENPSQKKGSASEGARSDFTLEDLFVNPEKEVRLKVYAAETSSCEEGHSA